MFLCRYGSYPALSKLCGKSIDDKDNIIVIGCGNSEFSSDLYDAGYLKITNIDFSERVIVDMGIKNALRDHMRWNVMDMTNMTFVSQSFDVVFDKGALDALMSDSSDETRASATRMFNSIDRVLKPGGRYICVSLAEPFIVYHLLDHFLSAKWVIDIYTVTECGGSNVPFIPFYLVLNKPMSETESRQMKFHPYINIYFNTFGDRLKRATSVTANDCLDQVLNPNIMSNDFF